MNRFLLLTGTIALIFTSACYKPLNLEVTPVPGNTLILEFAQSVKFPIELTIDGRVVPIRYSGKNRRLWVEGLESGSHNFVLNSISYVFGPEYDGFQVNETQGAYFFIQARKYRSSLPQSRSQISIRAYRRKLRREGVDVDKPFEGVTLRAAFRDDKPSRRAAAPPPELNDVPAFTPDDIPDDGN